MKNIILKSFDGEYCKQILETALAGTNLNTVLHITEDETQIPNINAKNQIWIPARKQREGNFDDIDQSTLLPLDEKLIEEMYACEATFMLMVGRHVFKKSFAVPLTYDERRQQYIDTMRYWNHMLETKEIDMFLSNHIPHQGYDWVLYELCKLKGIPTLMLDRFAESETFFITKDWEKPAEGLKEAYAAAKETYKDGTDIPLSQHFEAYYQLNEHEEEPWYFSQNRKEYLKKSSFIGRWKSIAFRLLLQKPFTLLRMVLSPNIWRKKLSQHAVVSWYETHAEKNPDLNTSFVYVALHMQPEASTCPKGGVFADQQRIVELLAWHLPPDVKLYVKEHPNQTDFMRSTQWYKDLAKIPCVTLISKNVSTFQLIKSALATATVAGSAGLESLFKEKPVLMFGHWFYQYAPGVHCISSSNDCQKALEAILEGNSAPTKHDMRIFLKAMEMSGAEAVVCTTKQKDSRYTNNEQANIMGEYIHKHLQSYVNA